MDITDKISYREKIGSGAHCDAYAVQFFGEIDIDGNILKDAVVKKFKNPIRNLEEIITLYSYIKTKELKTLGFLKKIQLEILNA